MLEHPDRRLVEAARSGDTAAFGELYRRHYAAMAAVAYAVLADRHLAEDAAQEAFAIACRDMRRLRRADRFAAWLRGICRNVARRWARSRPRPVGTPHVLAPTVDPLGDGLAAAVRQSVQRLSHSAREVILLRYFSGLSYEQIAGLLNISSQAVHGRLTRARRKLANDLQRNGLPRRQP